jgi:hypothetical protein
MSQPQATSTSSAPAGWYPDPSSAGLRYWDGSAWSALPGPGPAQGAAHGVARVPATWFDPRSEASADALAGRIATYERVSGVLWIVLGVLQVLSVALIIAGAWNIIAGTSRLGIAPAIARRESGVPQAFAGVAGLVIIGLVNLFFGAAFGLIMVAVDFYVRQRVLDNAHVFNK